jgi:hypothetical protein
LNEEESNDFIFDAILEQFGQEKGMQFLNDAYQAGLSKGDSLFQFFGDGEDRELYPIFDGIKSRKAVADIILPSLKDYLDKAESRRGPPSVGEGTLPASAPYRPERARLEGLADGGINAEQLKEKIQAANGDISKLVEIACREVERGLGERVAEVRKGINDYDQPEFDRRLEQKLEAMQKTPVRHSAASLSIRQALEILKNAKEKYQSPAAGESLLRPVIANGEILFRIDSRVLHIFSRDIIVVVLPSGKRQAFYKSTGRNSYMPGKWLPFDGITFGVIDGTPMIYLFSKGAYTTGKDSEGRDLGRSDNPLNRYGTPELKEIGEQITSLNRAGMIPKGEKTARVDDINNHIGTAVSLEYNDAYNRIGKIYHSGHKEKVHIFDVIAEHARRRVEEEKIQPKSKAKRPSPSTTPSVTTIELPQIAGPELRFNFTVTPDFSALSAPKNDVPTSAPGAFAGTTDDNEGPSSLSARHRAMREVLTAL